MSRAAVAARKADRQADRELVRLDAWRVRLERDQAQDAILAACDNCGLVQVAGGYRSAYPCFVCGHPSGTFVERLPGHLLA